MPCGGIYYLRADQVALTTSLPVGHPDLEGVPRRQTDRCLYCTKTDIVTDISEPGHLDHFCAEWDGYLHSKCIPAFMKTDEGQIIIDHQHMLELGPDVDLTSSNSWIGGYHHLVDIESVDQPQLTAHAFATATEKS